VLRVAPLLLTASSAAFAQDLPSGFFRSDPFCPDLVHKDATCRAWPAGIYFVHDGRAFGQRRRAVLRGSHRRSLTESAHRARVHRGRKETRTRGMSFATVFRANVSL
jgi:hypothetical protein